MSCFLKDHCNRLLSHCSVKGCDFFPNTTNPEKGKEKENHFGRYRSFFRFRFLGLIDLSTSFIKLEYIFILMTVLLGSRATNSSVELLLCVTLLK